MTRSGVGSVRVRRVRVAGRSLIAKSATGAARARLRLEAELLQAMAGLPVVTLVAVRERDERTDLVTEDAGPHDLARPGGLDPETLLEALAATAAAVDSLHAGGWSHGALAAAHVVLTPGGDVRLCSVGSAASLAARPDGLVEDRTQLLELVRATLARTDPAWDASQRRRWRHMSRQLERRRHAGPGTAPDLAPDAAELAELLRSVAGPSPQVLSASTVRLLAGTLVVVAAVMAWGATRPAAESPDRANDVVAAPPTSAGTRTPSTTSTAERAAPRAAPGSCDDGAAAIDTDGDGCAEATTVDGNLVQVDGVTYQVGRPEDQVLVGPLRCGDPARVVVLRPTTGEVFTFATLPTQGSSVGAEQLATTTDVLALELAASPCTRVVLRSTDGAVMPLAPEATNDVPAQEPPT